jgi:hypothetical protein
LVHGFGFGAELVVVPNKDYSFQNALMNVVMVLTIQPLNMDLYFLIIKETFILIHKKFGVVVVILLFKMHWMPEHGHVRFLMPSSVRISGQVILHTMQLNLIVRTSTW